MTSPDLQSSLAPTPFPWRHAAVLVALSVLIYLPAFSAGFIWDDPDYIINNKNLRDLPGLVRTWTSPHSLPQWYPIVHTTFWVEYHLWQLWSPGYHVVNIALHALGALALFWVLVRLDLSVKVAFLGALLWSIHPVQVESVAWVTERKNTLSALFYFLSIGLLLLWEQRRGGKHAWGLWLAALGLFVLALGSKTVTASLPAAWLLVRYWKTGRVDLKRDVVPLIPFFVIGFAAGQMTAWLERNHVGASGIEWNFTKADRVLIAGRAVWFYLYKLAFPIRLAFIYERWDLDPRVVWQWLLPIAALALGVALFLLRHRITRGPVVAYAFFVGTLFPALGFFNVYPFRYSFVADHFQHIASVSPLVLAAVLIARWPKAVTFALIATLSVLTLIQTRIYEDPLTLWNDTIAKSPNSWMAYTNRAITYRDMARDEKILGVKRTYEEKVLADVVKARDLAPHVAETHWVLGVAYAQRNDWAAARACFEKSVSLDATYVPPQNSLGAIEMREGKLAEAEKLFRSAIALQPGFLAARSNLGELLARQGKKEEAAKEYAAAVNTDPTRFDDRLALARVLRDLGKETKSIETLTYAASHFNEALNLRPNDAQVRFEFGETMLLLNDRPRAVALLESAAKLNPSLAPQVQALLQ